MQVLRIHALIFLIVFLLTSCFTPLEKPPHGMSVDQMIQDVKDGIQTDKKMAKNHHRVPHYVREALLTSSSKTASSQMGGSSEKRFDVSANKLPAKTFFLSLVEGTPINIVVNPDVMGDISIELKNVTITQVLEATRDAYGFDYRKTSYGYEIYAQKIETRIFTVNFLDMKRTGKSLTEVTSGQISEQIAGVSSGGSGAPSTPVGGTQTTPSGSMVDTRTDTDFWHDLEVALKQLVGTEHGHSVVVNPQSGVVIVKAFPKELRSVAHYLDRIQANMNRQVILEAKILEVQLNDQFQAGIDWNIIGHVIENHDGGAAQSSTLADFGNTTLSAFTPIFTLRVNGKDFGALIDLLETQGNVQVLSSPHVATVNNQKAVIKVGQDQFFVTGITTTNVVSGIGNSAFPSENINLTPFFSGITLDVTPQISNDGEIVLHIHPTVSKVTDQTKTLTLGNNGAGSNPNEFILPLAQSTIRETDTIVRAKNGQVIVIGGLMQNDQEEQVAGIPYISKIPIIGPFFRRTQQLSQKIELVILLRPIITNNKAYIDYMSDQLNVMENVRRGFREGGLPSVFGNEGDHPPY